MQQEKEKQDDRIYHWKKQAQEIAAEIGNSILTAYFLVMMIVYPLYVKNGYWEIGDTKYYFFRNVSLLSVGIMLLVVIFLFLLQGKRFSIVEHYRRLSGTDWFVYGYLISVLLSYVFSVFRAEAFWGTSGWHMGFVPQLLFVSIYFLFSRYFIWNEKILYVALTGSFVVFLLGILNRYSVYPFAISGQTPVFISTIGNINWFCGYWAVICPLGIVLYWNSQDRRQRVAAGIYVIVSFMVGVVQGSSSAYLALAGLFIFLLVLSFRENRGMFRFLEICILFALSCQTARILRYLPDFELNYEMELGTVLTDTNVALYAGIIAGALYLLFGYAVKRKDYQIAQHKSICRTVLVLFFAVLAGYLVLLVGNTCLPGSVPGLSDMPAFIFNGTWANSRGATWTSGWRAFRRMSPLHKLVGIGPDCFAEYIYAVPELAAYAYEQFGNSRLTNAHNEWLTTMVNCGALGLVCYVGIFVSAFLGFLRKARIQPALYLCAACILVYTLHNMVSFQQVLNTPFFFIILGIGEGIRRKASLDTDTEINF